MLSMRQIHLWVPNIFEFRGGIQAYSGFLLQGLQRQYPDTTIRVFLKHDRTPAATVPRTYFHGAGRWPLRVRTWVYGLQLLWGCLRHRPDLIIATHTNFAPLGVMCQRWLGVRFWAVAHGIEVWGLTDGVLLRSLLQTERILAVSHYTRDRFLAEQPHLDPTRITVLPNTFDHTRFYPAPKPPPLLQQYGLNPEQPVILTVARLDATQAYKGYDQILRALPQVRSVVPEVRYVVVGQGSDRDRIEALIARLGLDEVVILAGFVPDQALVAHYHLCDLFAMPSRGEGFGIVYLEAIACGKPTLGGNQDGAIDALKGGELGVLVDPDDVEAIAQAMIRILTHTEPHPLLQNPTALRQAVIETYGFEAFTRTLADAIGSLQP
jgi:glycosyltransferase involved in cell wall biosynthesis